MWCSDVLFMDNFIGNIIVDSQYSKNVHRDMKSLGRERQVIFHKKMRIYSSYSYTQRTTGLCGIRQTSDPGGEPYS